MSIQNKIFFSVGTIILLFVVAFATFTGIDSAKKIQSNIEDEISKQQSHIYDLLSTTDSIMAERVQSSMRLLKKLGNDLGEPRIEGSVSVNGVQANNIFIGNEAQGNHFNLVDGLTDIMGGTATIFSKTENDYIRISTNVVRDNKRAIGTKLSATGKAIAQINNDQAYYGAVDILGNPYLTGYAPMKDASGQTIGIWYVGYSADLESINNTIENSKILENGFVALIDNKNNIRTHSKHISSEQVSQALENHDAWQVTNVGFDKWGYKIVLVTNHEDVSNMISAEVMAVVGRQLIAGVFILATIFLVTRSITRPLKRAVNLSKSIANGKLDTNIEVKGKDETAELLRAMQMMVNTLQAFSAAQKEMARKHEEGVIDHFVDDESFPGVFGELAKANNELVASNIAITMKAVDVTARYAAGDLSSTMDRLPGQKAKITDAVDGVRTSLQAISDEISTLVAAAVAGNFTARGNEDKYQNEFKAMIVGLNKLMQTSDTGLTAVSRALTGFAKGDLSYTIDGQYQGTFLQLKEDCNSTSEQLRELVAQIKVLVAAAAAGNFAIRGDASKYQNEFHDMVAGLNQLMETSDTGLGEVSRVLRALAKCDLTDTITGDYQGTFLQLKEDTNSTVEQLRIVMQQISTASEAINVGATEIASGNMNLSSRTEQQAASLEETSATMQQINSTVKKNAKNADTANELAASSNAGVAKSGKAVSQLAETMGEIHASSNKIADIISLIDGIAFQTNILALNAAVEAARAGEGGRGFAVVASEVRNLAQRSASAAKDISDLIAASVTNVDIGAQQVKATGTAMEDVVVNYEQLADLVAQISSASSEQSTGIEEVFKAVTQMDDGTQQNAALVEQAAAAAESLQHQAGSLVAMVAKFKQVKDGSEMQSAEVYQLSRMAN